MRDFTPYEVQYRSKSEKLGPKLPGAGLAQWTSKSRRDAFFAQGRDILFDLDGQVSFLVQELRSNFAGVNTAINAPSVTVQHAGDVVGAEVLGMPGTRRSRPRSPKCSFACEAVG